MTSSRLTAESRQRALSALEASTSADQELDVLVIGGGVTGAGIALDAVTRGLSTAIVEAQDWAAGTSSRSSKLVHGGLRYLQMLDFHLVHEALTERDLLIKDLAPHLVRPVPFLYPLEHRVWERAYVGAGIALYDTLASMAPGKRALPLHRHLSRKQMERKFPDLAHDAAIGAVQYWDASVDDARLVSTLIRTATSYGAHAASRTQVVEPDQGPHRGGQRRDPRGPRDGPPHHGPRTRRHQRDGRVDRGHRGPRGLRGRPARARLEGRPHRRPARAHQGPGRPDPADREVGPLHHPVVALLGHRHDRHPVGAGATHPVATSADIEYILEHANAVLAQPLTRDDIIGTYAGLRPCSSRAPRRARASAKVSREHTTASPTPGLTVIAGGKLTTYRVMAKDAVDFAIGQRSAALPSITDKIPLIGAVGLDAVRRQARPWASKFGWTPQMVDHLLHRYGSNLRDIVALCEADPTLAKPLEHAPAYLRAEIAYGVTHEGALHLEDLLLHRTRLNYEVLDRGLGALPEIADIAAPLLGWSDEQRAAEIESYTARAAAEEAAEQEPDDATAERTRLAADDIAPLKPLDAS